MVKDEYVLWKRAGWECVMVSCCAGAELQLRKIHLRADTAPQPDFEIVLRELYPTKSDLYERSRDLEAEYT